MAQEIHRPILSSFRSLSGQSERGLRADASALLEKPQFDWRSFDLGQNPFGDFLDPTYLHTTAELRAVYGSLLASIYGKPGLFLLMGKRGTGKTALLQRLAQELRASGCIVISDYRAGLALSDLAAVLSRTLGIPNLAGDRRQWLTCIRTVIAERAQAQDRIVLMIDDAENLGGEVIVNLRPLMEAPKGGLGALRLVLAAEPGFRHRLGLTALADLIATLVVHHQLEPLSDDHIESLVWHRLRCAGHRSADLFSDAAIAAVARHARGVPGRAVRLCAAALRLADAAGEHTVTEALVERAAGERHPDNAVGVVASLEQHRPFRLAHPILASALIGGLGVFVAVAAGFTLGVPDVVSRAPTQRSVSGIRGVPDANDSIRQRAPGNEDETVPMLVAWSEESKEVESVAWSQSVRDIDRTAAEVPVERSPTLGASDAPLAVAAESVSTAVDAGTVSDDSVSARNVPAGAPPSLLPPADPINRTPSAADKEAPTERTIVPTPTEINDQTRPPGSALATSDDSADRNDGTPQPSRQLRSSFGQAAGREDTEEVVGILVARGERQIAAGQLASPPGDNALKTFRLILAIAPESSAGPQLLERIRSSYREQARAAQRMGNSAEAVRLYELAVDPAVGGTVQEVGVAQETRQDDRSAIAGSGTTTPPPAHSQVVPPLDAAVSAGELPSPLQKHDPADPNGTQAEENDRNTAGMLRPGVGGGVGREPASRRAEPVPMTKEMLAVLMKRGHEMLALGDISAARLLFERAANAGDAKAATAAGKTYDPLFLKETVARGVQPHPDRASDWYRRAVEAGDAEAEARLMKLRAASGEARAASRP